MAKVYNLPTGEELMNTPIVSGGESRREKEINFLMQNVEGRLTSLQVDEKYEVSKLLLFIVGIISGMVGVTLILFGLHTTYIFDKYPNDNIPAVVFGCLFCLPILFWFVFLFVPSRAEVQRRRRIHRERRERRKPTLFNEMVSEAKKKAAPPPRKIRVLAHVRKHDYPVTVSTWKEFCELVENATGLPIERQLIRFQETDLHIDLAMRLIDPPYNLDNGDRLHIYNRGGFFTADAPIRVQQRELAEAAAILVAQQRAEEEKKLAEVPSQFSMLKASFRSSFTKKKSFAEPGNRKSGVNGGGGNNRHSLTNESKMEAGIRSSSANNNGSGGMGEKKKSSFSNGGNMPKSSLSGGSSPAGTGGGLSKKPQSKVSFH